MRILRLGLAAGALIAAVLGLGVSPAGASPPETATYHAHHVEDTFVDRFPSCEGGAKYIITTVSNLVSHVTIWDPATQDRLAQWTSHFMGQGADSFTAQRRALAMLYHDVVGQAQVLAYADDFWLLAILFSIVPLFLPLMRRVHAEPVARREEDDPAQVRPLPAPVD